MSPTAARIATLLLAIALAPPATAVPGRWKLVREVPVLPGTMVVAFLDDQNALSTGCPAPMNRSVDGGRTWSYGYARELCRSGLELVPGLAVDTGNGSDIRRSTDQGVHWERVAAFGEPFPHHPRLLSFLDARRGAIASDVDLATTDDGGRTWQRRLVPEQAEDLAAISLARDGGREVLRVLDEAGALWRSDDLGKTWAAAPSPLAKRVLGFPEQVRQMPHGPTAALRFVGAEGVLAATLDDGGTLTGHVYRTRDGGATWAEEQVSPPFPAAVLTLSLDGKILSALDTASATAKVYRAE